MKKVLFHLLPLFIILGFFGMMPILSYFSSRYMDIEIWGHFYTKMRLFAFVSFPISYFLTGLVIKNKKNIVWFIALYIAAFLFPLFWGITGIIYLTSNFIYTFQCSFFAIFLYLGCNWLKKDRQMKELEKQNLQSELALLKNQINPHFLFNTLNNIDSLIKSNPDQASQSLIELSGIMRYMLYETNANRVPLQKELDYISDYLKLQKVQYANSELIDYSVSGKTENIKIAPMLFIPFVENAFKHCTDKEKAHAIQFQAKIETEQICFKATNISDSNHPISKDSSSGIGLETVKRRLEILYPKKYSLQINEKNNLFCVELNIKVDD